MKVLKPLINQSEGVGKMKVKKLLNDPYKCTIKKLAYHTRTQEDYNHVIRELYKRLDMAQNEVFKKGVIETIQSYMQCLTGYKEKFIIGVITE